MPSWYVKELPGWVTMVSPYSGANLDSGINLEVEYMRNTSGFTREGMITIESYLPDFEGTSELSEHALTQAAEILLATVLESSAQVSLLLGESGYFIGN